MQDNRKETMKNIVSKNKKPKYIGKNHPICANCGHCFPSNIHGVATPHSQSTEFKERHEVNGCTLCGAGMLGRGVRLIYIEGEPCDDCGVENDYNYFHIDDVVWC